MFDKIASLIPDQKCKNQKNRVSEFYTLISEFLPLFRQGSCPALFSLKQFRNHSSSFEFFKGLQFATSKRRRFLSLRLECGGRRLSE
jgi:hypothetical protein